MNIFIAGTNGFIGKNLVEHLNLNYNHKLFTPNSLELNLLNKTDIDNYITSNKIDIIIYAANKGGGRDENYKISNVLEINLRMSFNILIQSDKVHKIIYLGSGAEYGKHKPIINAKETDSKTLPFDEYGLYKFICAKYAENSKNIYHLRIFGVYGKYEKYKAGFVSNAIVKNLIGMPIEIMQDVFFDYIYVKDLVKIISYFVEHEGKYKIYNATSGAKINIVSLAKIINDISNFKSEILIKNPGLNLEYASNNERIRKEIKDLTFTAHSSAIRELYNYYSSILDTLDIDGIKSDELINLIKINRKNNGFRER